MNILITGGTGFIGRALVEKLNVSHRITVLTRRLKYAKRKLGDGVTLVESLNEFDNLDDFAVVINLAGEPIANRRWSAHRKREICSSRWKLTQQIVDKIKAGKAPPKVLISASAIGYYGRQGDYDIDESFDDIYQEFSHEVCAKWESIAKHAQTDKTRVCILRLGIVIGPYGGALLQMLPAYQLGLGGPIASGKQWMSWIHRTDVIQMIRFLMDNESMSGVFNATAPNPVTNKVFSRTLAHVLRRPHLFFVPGFILRLVFGEMADLLVYGQKVLPKRFLEQGFTFAFPQLENALADALQKQPHPSAAEKA